MRRLGVFLGICGKELGQIQHGAVVGDATGIGHGSRAEKSSYLRQAIVGISKSKNFTGGNFMRILFILAIAILAGCATKYDRLRNYAGADSGTVIVTLGQTNENYMNYSSIWFKSKEAEDLGAFQYDPKSLLDSSPKDFADSKGAVTFIAQKLPPGEYEITGFSSGSDYGTSSVTYRNRSTVAIPFSVKAGEVSYLGQYLVGLQLVDSRPVSATLEITDEGQRDFKGSKTVAPVSATVRRYLPTP